MHVTKHRTIDPACLENPRPEGAESGEHRFAIFVSSPNTFFRKVEGYSGLHLHRQVSYPTVTTGKLVENPKEEPEGMRESTRNFREKIHSKDRDPLQFRPWAPLPYSHPGGASTWISPLASVLQVPTFHTTASWQTQATLMPDAAPSVNRSSPELIPR